MIPFITTLICFLLLLFWHKRKYILIHLMEWSLYVYILKNIIPYIRFSLYYPSFTGKQYHTGYKLLKPGDIILTKDNRKLSTFLIPGIMPHVAMFIERKTDVSVPILGKDGYEIVELNNTGYHKCDWFDVCKESDRIIILRCKIWDQDYIESTIIPEAIRLDGTPYDFQFKYGFKSLYCSELPLACDKEKRLKLDDRDLLGIGRRYVCADDYLNSRDFGIIWDSDDV